MSWGIENPTEFHKLFKKVIITNDIQIKEDLYSIAMGIVFSIPSAKSKEYVTNLSTWLIENLFSADAIQQNYSAAIRYYGYAIIRYANSVGCCSDSDLDLSSPPYKTTTSIPLNKEATSGERTGGLDYDVSHGVAVARRPSAVLFPYWYTLT